VLDESGTTDEYITEAEVVQYHKNAYGGDVTYTFKLDFKSGDTTKGQLPGMMAQVKLGVFGDDVEDAPVVSHQCLGPTEWKSEMQRLKDELEAVEAEGLRKINEHHRKVLEGSPRG